MKKQVSFICFVTVLTFSTISLALDAIITKKDGSNVILKTVGFRDSGCERLLNRSKLKLDEARYSALGGKVMIDFKDIDTIKMLDWYHSRDNSDRFKVKVFMRKGALRVGYWGGWCSEGGVAYRGVAIGHTDFGEETILLKDINTISFQP